MADELDDILNSALDEVQADCDRKDSTDLSTAARNAALHTAEAAEEAKAEALKASASGESSVGSGDFKDMLNSAFDDVLGGAFDDKMLAETIASLSNDDPELFSYLQASLKGLKDENSNVDNTSAANLAKTFSSLVDAAEKSEGSNLLNNNDTIDKLSSDMLKSLESLDDAGDISGALDSMFEQLLSKSVMYEPIKQVKEKFKEWLKDNKETIDSSERDRYEKQYRQYELICEEYEKERVNFMKITTLLQEVQAFGDPPAEVMKSMAPGLEVDENGAPKANLSDLGLEEASARCNQQ